MLFSGLGSRRWARGKAGSTITETGPALFILFLLVLFPMIDFLYLGVAYGISWYLNHLEVRELALRRPEQSSQALADVDNAFLSQGLGKFVGLTAETVAHPDGPQRSGDPLTVRLTTTTTVKPFLSIPFFFSVPGLNAPMTFSMTSSRLQEELGQD
jgi:hypothetical protein